MTLFVLKTFLNFGSSPYGTGSQRAHDGWEHDAIRR
jgi:hypothetical protein